MPLAHHDVLYGGVGDGDDPLVVAQQQVVGAEADVVLSPGKLKKVQGSGPVMRCWLVGRSGRGQHKLRPLQLKQVCCWGNLD